MSLGVDHKATRCTYRGYVQYKRRLNYTSFDLPLFHFHCIFFIFFPSLLWLTLIYVIIKLSSVVRQNFVFFLNSHRKIASLVFSSGEESYLLPPSPCSIMYMNFVQAKSYWKLEWRRIISMSIFLESVFEQICKIRK